MQRFWRSIAIFLLGGILGAGFGVATSDDAWRALATLPARWIVPVFPLKAADFLKRNVPKGPALGEAMRVAEDSWIAADFLSDVVSIEAIADAAIGKKS